VRIGISGWSFCASLCPRRPRLRCLWTRARFNAALADAEMKARLAELGSVPMPMTPAEFGKLIADETEKWAKVVKFSGAKPD
jgi:tripartite-type tricarboxylate transporter receptor subunit TctC